MGTRSSPEDLNDIVQNIHRRLHALETGSRLSTASIPAGGALTVLNDQGQPVLRIGTLSIGGYGIERFDGSAWVAVT